MANFAVGTFTKRTTTGTDSVTGLGFQPKFVMCWTSWAPTSTDLTTNTSLRLGMGFAAGTAAADQGAFATISTDAAATGNSGRRHDQCLLLRCDSAGGLLSRATLQSFDAGGFTINWDTNAGGSEWIHYLAIGGSDFSAKVVKYLQTTGTGGASRAVTGAGFAPTAALSLVTGITAVPPGSTNTVQNAFGFAKNGGSAISVALTSQNLADPTGTRRSWRNDAIAHKVNASADSEGWRMTVSSWDSDGFTLAQTEGADTADDHIYFAFFNGINVDVSSLTKPTGAAPQTNTITPGFRPEAAVFVSDAQAGGSNGTVVAHARFMVGAADRAGNHAGIFVRDIDNIATTQTDSWPSNTKSHLINNDTDDTLETYGTTAFSATQVTLTHNPNSSEATQMFALVLGTVAAPPPFLPHQKSVRALMARSYD